MYVEPAALEITSVMTQLRSVLFEYKTLAELEQTTAPPTPLPENLQYQLIQSSQWKIQNPLKIPQDLLAFDTKEINRPLQFLVWKKYLNPR